MMVLVQFSITNGTLNLHLVAVADVANAAWISCISIILLTNGVDVLVFRRYEHRKFFVVSSW